MKLRNLGRNGLKIIQNWWIEILAIIFLISVIILIWVGYVRFTTGGWPDWAGFVAKILWDLTQLLIVPAVLAIGAYLLNESARKREQDIAEQNRQETALQTYLDKMTELLLKEKLREKEQYLFNWDFIPENGTERLKEFLMQNYHIDWAKKAKVEKIDNKAIRISTEKNSLFLRLRDEDTRVVLEIDDGRIGEFIAKRELSKLNIYSEQNPTVRDVARARTLTVLRKLDEYHKRALLQFLYEADLISKDKIVIYLGGANLGGANLSGANLSGANLSLADLSGANLSLADLSGADLINANLRGADLRKVAMIGADLNWADLSGANLRKANLGGADLINANLSLAYLSKAAMIGADLSGANLSGADLRGADLRKANPSGASLGEAKYTKNAKDSTDTIWPDGFDPEKAGAICVNE